MNKASKKWLLNKHEASKKWRFFITAVRKVYDSYVYFSKSKKICVDRKIGKYHLTFFDKELNRCIKD